MSNSTQPNRPVIVGIGLTEESAYVLQRVCSLAGDASRVIAVHVTQRPLRFDHLDGVVAPPLEESLRHAQESAQRDLAALCEPLGVKQFLVEEGKPATVLHRIAEEKSARSIAIGTHGYHGWRAIIGETANSVLHGSPCDVYAVLTKGHSAQPASSIKKIIVALDMTDDAETVLRRAVEVQSRYAAELMLLSVVKPLNHAYPGLDPAMLLDTSLNFEGQAREQQDKHLKQLGSQFGVEQCVVRTGDIAAEIHHASEEFGADLVVMGSHARQGFQLILGSSPNAVLHGLNTDLYAVRV